MRNEKNITGLIQQLQALGFGDGKGKELRAHICFQPQMFEVAHLIHKEDDVVIFRIHLEPTGNGIYGCNYYDAILRKPIELPAECGPLETKMQLIDWAKIEEHAEEIEEVVIDLQALTADADGKKNAELLRFKYWSDTPAEHLVTNLQIFRSQFETSQRFYLSDGQGITTEEAYRFLCNRWVEKRLLARRKESDAALKGGLPGVIVAGGEKKAGQKRKIK